MSCEPAKGYTKPLYSCGLRSIPDEIVAANEKLLPKRKLALILKYKDTKEICVAAGDMIEVFPKSGIIKTGKWFTPKIVLSVHVEAHTAIVPPKAGKHFTVALEDVRPALPEESIAQAVQDAIYNIDDTIEIATSSGKESEDTVTSDTDATSQIYHEGSDSSSALSRRPNNTIDKGDVKRGDHVMVHWPDDNTPYSGTIKHFHRDGSVTVTYDNGDKERLDLNDV